MSITSNIHIFKNINENMNEISKLKKKVDELERKEKIQNDIQIQTVNKVALLTDTIIRLVEDINRLRVGEEKTLKRLVFK